MVSCGLFYYKILNNFKHKNINENDIQTSQVGFIFFKFNLNIITKQKTYNNNQKKYHVEITFIIMLVGSFCNNMPSIDKKKMFTVIKITSFFCITKNNIILFCILCQGLSLTILAVVYISFLFINMYMFSPENKKKQMLKRFNKHTNIIKSINN